MFIFWNGKTVEITDRENFLFFNRAFHFGDGVYETFAVKNGQTVFMEEHLKRLFYDAQSIHLPISKDISEWSGNVESVIKSNNIIEGFIKIIVSRGTITYHSLEYPDDIEPTTFIWGLECKFLSLSERQPLRIMISEHERRNQYSLVTYVKTLNYLSNIIAKKEAKDKGCDEAIFLNTDGHVAEATTSNIFLVNKENKLLTPQISTGLLNGVIRHKVIETAMRLGIEVEEKLLTKEDLKEVKGCFLTSSLLGIAPVSEIIDVAKYEVADFIDIVEKLEDNYEKSV